MICLLSIFYNCYKGEKKPWELRIRISILCKVFSKKIENFLQIKELINYL